MSNDELVKLFVDNYRKTVKFDNHLGMTLTMDDIGDATYTLTVDERHLTAPDSAHGGVAAAMMDAALGVAVLSYAVSQGNFCATVEFKINYLRPVKPGNVLVAHGKIKHKGKRLVVSEGNITEQGSGELVATGIGTFTQYPMDRRKHVVEEAGKTN